MSRATFEEAFAAWAEALDLECVWAHDTQEAGPQPEYPFVEFEVVNETSPDLVERSHTYDEDADVGEEVRLVYQQHKTLCLRIKVMSVGKPPKDAGTLMADLLKNLHTLARREAFTTAGLAYSSQKMLLRQPYKAGTSWIDCAVADVDFNFTEIADEHVGYIDTVEVTPDVDDAQSNDPFTVGPT
jgi:hypothetical protein